SRHRSGGFAELRNKGRPDSCHASSTIRVPAIVGFGFEGSSLHRAARLGCDQQTGLLRDHSSWGTGQRRPDRCCEHDSLCSQRIHDPAGRPMRGSTKSLADGTRLPCLKPAAQAARSFYIGWGNRPCTMRTAKEMAADLHAVPDDPAMTMLTDRRDRLNRTFQAVERVLRARRNQVETLVVDVAADFALCHGNPPFPF